MLLKLYTKNNARCDIDRIVDILNQGRHHLPPPLDPTEALKAFESDDTGIDHSEFSNQKTTVIVIYDLTGRRVEKMEKGIYIVNGKKVVIK